MQQWVYGFALVVSLAVSINIVTSAKASTLNVPARQPTIQAAINAAVNGDVIIVAPGTYMEKINFQGKFITVKSSGGPALTTINATGQSSAVVSFQNGETVSSMLDGFTLTGGIGLSSGGSRVGGGVYVSGADPSISNCVIRNNSADNGGGMYSFAGDPRVINCVFNANVCLKGGAAFANFSNPILLNCTLAGNNATVQAGGVFSTSATARLINCVVWGNTSTPFAGDTTPIVSRSDVEGGYPGTGNLNANPQFVNLASGDLHLAAGSACIDAGDSTSIASLTGKDISGSARGVDDPTVPDFGVPVFGLTVDMGAYERQAVSTCAADSDHNNVVNIDDLLSVLAQWGACPGP
jgi:hypothetical protein